MSAELGHCHVSYRICLLELCYYRFHYDVTVKTNYFMFIILRLLEPGHYHIRYNETFKTWSLSCSLECDCLNQVIIICIMM